MKYLNDLLLYAINKNYSESPEYTANAILKEQQKSLKEEVDKWMTDLITGTKVGSSDKHFYFSTDSKAEVACDKASKEYLKSLEK